MMRALLSFLVAFCPFWSTSAWATDWNVHPGQSIQSAINQAQNGDRIFVHPGTYATGLRFFGKQIEVIGAGPSLTTVLDLTAFNLPALTADAGETYATKVQNIKFRLAAVGNDSILARVVNAQLTLENVAVEEASSVLAPGRMLRVTNGGLRVSGLSATGSRRRLLEGTGATVEIAGLNYSLTSNLYLGETYLVEMTTSSSLVLGGSITAVNSVTGFGVIRCTDSGLALSALTVSAPNGNQGCVRVTRGDLSIASSTLTGQSCIASVSGAVTINNSTVSSSSGTAVSVSGGSLAIQGLTCNAPNGNRVISTSGATHVGVWTDLTVNPTSSGGGISLGGPVEIDGFSIKNTQGVCALRVEVGGVFLRNGTFQNCRTEEPASLGNNTAIGSALLVRSAGASDVRVENVDFVDCSASNPSGGFVTGGIVGILASGRVEVIGCEFIRPRGVMSLNQPTLGLCVGVVGGAPLVENCDFLFPGSSQVGLSFSGAVAVGVLQATGGPTVVRDCVVDYSAPSPPVAAIFGCVSGVMLVERTQVLTANGGLFRGSAEFSLVESAVRFEPTSSVNTQIALGNNLGGGFGQPSRVNLDRSWIYHSGAPSGTSQPSVMELNAIRSRFTGWPGGIAGNRQYVHLRDCVVDRMNQPFSGIESLSVERTSFAYINGSIASGADQFSLLSAKDSIFYSTGGFLAGSYSFDSGATYSLFDTTTPGVGNIVGDPLFADPFFGDYSLLPGSPCINTGDPASPLDPDGTRADMGARYQYGMADCNANGVSDAIDVLTEDCNFNARVDSCELTIASDCNNDGQLDVCQIAAGVFGDCDGDGRPNGCEADCNQNGAADDCDLQQASLYDCNSNGLVDSCETASGAALDCNGNSIPDGCDLASGASLDLNHNGVPDECKPDCNQNNIPDFIEIAYGTVPDCNANLVPDACELASGAAADCDASGVPDGCEATAATDCDADGALDACELASGAEPDCNSNQRPDRCDLAGGSLADCDADLVFDSCELADGAPDCNGNQRIDSCDIASGASLDLNLDGHPDECKPDCNANGIPDYIDVQFGASLDCNANIVPDECELPTNPQLDCNGNSQIDSCEVATGVSPDCNANQLPDSCDIAADAALDCNGNLAIDRCEVASGAAPDCDGNQVPDGCDLAAGAADCDLDGVQDSCELAAGAADIYGTPAGVVACTPNGIPDSCEPANDLDGDGDPDYCEILAGAADAYGVSGGVVTCAADGVPDDNQPVADCDADGAPDACELLAGAADCDADGLQDSCQATPATDCDGDGVLDTCELAAGAADGYGLAGSTIACAPNGVPDVCEVVGDADLDGVPDYCEIQAGASDLYGAAGGIVTCGPDGVPDDNQPVPDCDVDGLPDFCEIQAGAGDCDASGVPDACQLQTNPAVDCNLNGLIDSCELAGGGSDCNGNQRLDSCDIAVGLSVDANQNGVPDECECATSNFCIPLPNSTGQPALIALVGTPSLSLNNATLRCTQLPSSAFGLFFFGNSGLNPGNPFGNGRLCVTGGVRRLTPVQAVAGVVSQAQDFGSTAYAGIQSGDVRFFQYWYRNPTAGGAGFNLSDGIRVTFCP